ncbi:MAG: DUF2933 domain-containing protein [Patescibacteria group bacterium]
MLKKAFQKIKQNHFLLMAVCCLAPVVLIVVSLALFKGSGKYLVWLMILLCPILHILLMRGHKNNNSCEREKDEKGPRHYKCSECGFEYKEKEWAEKCKNWCSKYKSCNLEITKQAINKGQKLTI